jgi:hypothetical protein
MPAGDAVEASVSGMLSGIWVVVMVEVLCT